MYEQLERIRHILPTRVQNRVDEVLEAAEIFVAMKNPNVLRTMAPSAVRGLLLKSGKLNDTSDMQANHTAHFNWTYPHDHPEMHELYERAKLGQWNGSSLPWHTSVDPFDPNVPVAPLDMVDLAAAKKVGITLKESEQTKMMHSISSWMLSQFLHGEQGALLAASQVTESVQFFDGKLYGATQVVDEGRHVEVFHRYLSEKLGKMYPINDNLFVIIDALMTDSRWDMKFLGMQIMVEGLALGAFGFLYQNTREPLLKELLKYVIQDEARHVHYGVLALKEHFSEHISTKEHEEREDWAYEVALLMRNRFMAYEVYDDWYGGTSVTREQWRQLVTTSPGMQRFRNIMLTRLVPNIREIGLLTPRMRPHYEAAGMGQYFNGLAAPELTGEQMIADLDRARAA
ncbi:MAG: ferritin-like domain-containing protein [Fluviicoccus sp.]|uniref:ferritin-like domain-containing protein n=1 Tax=Fluviicoccus sp. TaxID=2003552 RepID=UPI00272381CD|nr:ferritin-like domain-containing protein [Fluviicoccus sp.]MDO8329358.1 ferritin-like domain-containing protein [Fluviicoccus sp.]